eukprot:663161-Amphidinium_carterae.1
MANRQYHVSAFLSRAAKMTRATVAGTPMDVTEDDDAPPCSTHSPTQSSQSCATLLVLGRDDGCSNATEVQHFQMTTCLNSSWAAGQKYRKTLLSPVYTLTVAGIRYDPLQRASHWIPQRPNFLQQQTNKQYPAQALPN